MDQAVLQYLLEMGAIQPEITANDRSRARAQALQDTAMPQGQMVSGHYVKPGWGAALNAGVRQVAGAYGEHRANKRDDELAKRKRSAFDVLAMSGQKPSSPSSSGDGFSTDPVAGY